MIPQWGAWKIWQTGQRPW